MSFLFSIIAFRKVRAEINFFPLSEGISEQTNIYDAMLVTLLVNKYIIVYNLLFGFESAVSRREQCHVATPRRRCQQGARVGIFVRETWLSSWPGSVY